jgi:putative cardiolipin synthase
LPLVLGACAQLQPRAPLPDEHAALIAAGAPLDQAFATLEANHPGESAFRLLTDGTEAFVARMQSARMAQRSLDVQTYIWHSDLTGKFLAEQLLEAADRGVKVRLLVDDMDARDKSTRFAALSSHPNIEVRVFNPFASRRGTVSFISEGARNFKRINRRMHNKTWIADNRVAFVGGRNLGDEYFGASDEVNFVDLDFAMIGPVVRDASASFDRYWNSPSAYPIGLLDEASVNPEALEKLRAGLAAQSAEAVDSRYARALRDDAVVHRLMSGEWPMEWSGSYQFVADDPAKITMEKRDKKRAAMAAVLLPVIAKSRSALQIISPYFVPGQHGSDDLVAAAQRGSQVSVLTNSLAANDVAAVHGGYEQYRKKLLKGGVHLWELKPIVAAGAPKEKAPKGSKAGKEEKNSSAFGSSGASLHTKALSIDDRTLFVGSYNLDPRSTWLNCEQGILVDNAALAAQFRQIFDTQTAGSRAWSVTLGEGGLHWSDGKEEFDSEPKASFSRRFQAWLARVLGLDAQL